MTSSKDRRAEQPRRARARSTDGAPPERFAWLRGPVGIAVAAVVIVGVGAGVGVMLTRAAPAPNSGARPVPMAARATPDPRPLSPQLDALALQIKREDAPTEKILEFAHVALDQQEFALAIPAYKRVLARDPKNAEALTHLGLILYKANHVDQALARIDEALRNDPKYAHAYWDRAQILYESKKDLGEAAKSLETFLTLMPKGEDADRARTLLADIRRSGGATAPAKP